MPHTWASHYFPVSLKKRSFQVFKTTLQDEWPFKEFGEFPWEDPPIWIWPKLFRDFPGLSVGQVLSCSPVIQIQATYGHMSPRYVWSVVASMHQSPSATGRIENSWPSWPDKHWKNASVKERKLEWCSLNYFTSLNHIDPSMLHLYIYIHKPYEASWLVAKIKHPIGWLLKSNILLAGC